MAFVAIKSSSLTLIFRHVERKRDGSFQYRRRIPKDLQSQYLGKQFFIRSLGRDFREVHFKSLKLTEDLDREWSFFRGTRSSPESSDQSEMVSNLLDKGRTEYSIRPLSTLRPTINLTAALTLYLSLHVKGNEISFRIYNERIIRRLVGRIGNMDITLISRSHAEDFRDASLRSQSTTTVRRNLDVLTAIVNRVRKEKQLQIANPFACLGIVKEGEDRSKRIPFTSQELGTISQTCRTLDDDIRHIVALQLDTGCRVAEVVGLRMEDVALDGPYPHLKIRPFGKVRTLKTGASERDIPLVGNALWAAERALSARRSTADGSPWLFPRYASDKEIKATHASNTLNKWLRSLAGVSSDKTTHCFRHAMRDRLRAAQVPHDIQEAIGGWGTRTTGQGYGNGYPLQVLAEHMHKIVAL